MAETYIDELKAISEHLSAASTAGDYNMAVDAMKNLMGRTHLSTLTPEERRLTEELCETMRIKPSCD